MVRTIIVSLKNMGYDDFLQVILRKQGRVIDLYANPKIDFWIKLHATNIRTCSFECDTIHAHEIFVLWKVSVWFLDKHALIFVIYYNEISKTCTHLKFKPHTVQYMVFWWNSTIYGWSFKIKLQE